MADRGPHPRRLLGLETEYAIRYSGPEPRPGNDQIYDAIVRAIAGRIALRPGDGMSGKNQVFLQNGGALNYEHFPHCPRGGLIEGATPECSDPAQLLLYQRAQDLLLRESLPLARELLHQQGFPGEVGLLKNCRDAEGHVYGAQENYEVEIARGALLVLYRLGLALLLPVVALLVVVYWLVHIVLLLLLVGITVAALAAVVIFPRLRRLRLLAFLAEADERAVSASLGRLQLWIDYVQLWPVAYPFSLLLRAVAFRRIRRQATAFLLTRPLLTGTGTVERDGRFLLSEKGPSLRRLMRASIRPEDRALFDTGNLLKQVAMPLNLRFPPILRLFERRQRLQLGLSDSNGAQVAELLKIASTSLVLDMVEAGSLEDAPRLKRPVAALKALIADPALETRLELAGGGSLSGLEIQRFYLERARRHLAEAPVQDLGARQALELWREVLDALEHGDLDSLVGRLDWVSKRFLVEASSAEEAAAGRREAVAKTVDLRYHELGDGYLAQLERQGRAPVLVDAAAVRRAILEPPRDSPARLRGELIRRRSRSPVPIRISWTSAWVGERFQARVIDFRSRRDRPEAEGDEPAGEDR